MTRALMPLSVLMLLLFGSPNALAQSHEDIVRRLVLPKLDRGESPLLDASKFRGDPVFLYISDSHPVDPHAWQKALRERGSYDEEFIRSRFCYWLSQTDYEVGAKDGSLAGVAYFRGIQLFPKSNELTDLALATMDHLSDYTSPKMLETSLVSGSARFAVGPEFHRRFRDKLWDKKDSLEIYDKILAERKSGTGERFKSEVVDVDGGESAAKVQETRVELDAEQAKGGSRMIYYALLASALLLMLGVAFRLLRKKSRPI